MTVHDSTGDPGTAPGGTAPAGDSFDGPDALTLRGQVDSGVGRGREFVTMAGYAEQFESELGYRPFPGTLNVDLNGESVARRDRLDGFDAVRIEEWSDGDRTYGGVDCYPVDLPLDRESEAAHLVVPDRTDHDEGQLELLAPDRLRDAGLDDGDRLVVAVTDE